MLGAGTSGTVAAVGADARSLLPLFRRLPFLSSLYEFWEALDKSGRKTLGGLNTPGRRSNHLRRITAGASGEDILA